MIIDNVLRDRLYHAYLSTDEEMRENQIYNIPHFADLNLTFYKNLFKMEEDTGYVKYGYQYSIGNLFTNDPDSKWEDKIYMNVNMNYDEPLYTPFIVFIREGDKPFFKQLPCNCVIY